MEYAQLNVDGTYSHQITTHGDVVWDSTHQCPASALTQEEAILFRVVPLLAVAQPSYDPLIESALRDGGELVDGRWQYRWTITALDAVTIAANAAMDRAVLTARTSTVTMRQARLELLKNGFLDAVNSAVAQMPTAAQIEWEFSGDVHRNNALVVTMQALLGWTDNQMDEFFISAHGL